MATMKKAQKGMTMKQLKSKYPDADTTAKGDVRGTEMNSGAPKKVLDRYNDTYNAFDKKFKGGAAKDKPSKMKMKAGGKVSKAQSGKTMSPVTVNSTTMNRGKKTVQTSPGGAYKMKTTTGPTGDTTRQVERRTLKGMLTGAPKARGVMKQTFKSGGKMKKK